MVKKFVVWFIVLALSFLVSNVFGLASQGVAFFIIHMGISIFFILAATIILVLNGSISGKSSESGAISFTIVLAIFITLFIIVFATKIAAAIFGIDFYVVYQIMTFGQCLCNNNS